jgi:hypothetical protein
MEIQLTNEFESGNAIRFRFFDLHFLFISVAFVSAKPVIDKKTLILPWKSGRLKNIRFRRSSLF